MKIWDPQELDTGGCYEAKIGLLKIWLKHTFEDWYVASERLPYTNRKELLASHFRPVRQEPREWNRWVFAHGTRAARLYPLMPDRPVVVRPDSPLRIPRGHRALFFVAIPLWIKIAAGERGAHVLCEIPTTVLSNTWFGDHATGELCYALRSHAKRQLEPADGAVHRAICPVSVMNNSYAELEFQRLCLRVELLSVYQAPGRLWTNRIDVIFRGEEQESQITISDSPPDLEREAVRLGKARRVEQRNLVRRSFQFLKTLTGF